MLKNKFLLALIAVMCSTAVLKAQNIQVDSARLLGALPAGASYGTGGYVAIPIKLNNCYSANNRFVWTVLDNTGASTGIKDSVSAFYATFINVKLSSPLLPTLATGNYKVRIVSIFPADTVYTPLFPVVNNASAVIANAVPIYSDQILRSQYYYGKCDGIVQAGMTLTDSSTIGGIDSLELRDDYRVGSPNTTYTPDASGNFNLVFNATLIGSKTRDAYYTAFVKTIKNVAGVGVVVSTRAYHIINNSWDIKVDVLGKAVGTLYSCGGDTVSMKIKTNQDEQLQQNFPGALIKVNWSDGPPQSYTQCDVLAANGVVKHFYRNGACKTAGKTSFDITTTVTNPFNVFNGPGVTGTCQAGAVSSSSAYVFSKPTASFKRDSVICAGDTVKFIANGLANPGQGPAANGDLSICANLANYTWVINKDSAAPIQLYKTGLGKVEPPKDTAYSFNGGQFGINTVTLIINNNYSSQSPCPSHDTTLIVCVDTAKVRPDFKLDTSNSGAGGGVGSLVDSIIGCSPQFVIKNMTRRTFCVDSLKFKYKWRILDFATMLPTDATNYKPFIDTDREPKISINKTGQYYIELNANATCELDTNLRMLKYVEANGDAGVQFSVGGIGTNPDTVRFCTTRTAGVYPNLVINYGSPSLNTQLTPSSVDSIRYTYKASAAPSLRYKWTITRVESPATTPTDYDFINGTTADSAYPVIRFKKPGLYVVTDSFFNNCQNKVATQYVAYREEVSIAGPSGPIDTICYNGTYNVSGFSIDTVNWGKVGSIEWTSSCGTFSPSSGLPSDPNMLTPVFTPTSNFTGTCSFTMAAYAPSPSSCTLKSVNRDIYFRPDVVLPDTAFNTCSGSQVGYKVTIPGLVGTLLTWTATSPTGGVSNFNPNNTTPLPLINDAPQGNGIIVYTVYPKVGTCVGAPFTVIDTVREIPGTPTVNYIKPINSPVYSMCSGDTIQYDVSGGYSYNWTSHDNQGKLVGLSTGSNNPLPYYPNTFYNFQNIVTNTGAPLGIDTATHCFTITSQYGCAGIDSTCKQVIVTPGPNIASITGLPDKYLCNQSCFTILHNQPGAAGVGTFTLVSTNTTAPTVVEYPDSAVVCGMIPGGFYKFKWTIDPQLAGCVSSSDSITLNVTDTLPTPFAGLDTAICDANGFTSRLVPLNVTFSRALGRFEYYFWNGGTLQQAVFPYTATVFPYNATISSLGAYSVPVRVSNGVCVDKIDTVVIRVFTKPSIGSVSVSPSQSSFCQGSTIALTSNFDTNYGQIGNWVFVPVSTGKATPPFGFGSNPLVYTVDENGLFGATIYSKGFNYGCYDSVGGGSKKIIVDTATIAGTLASSDTIVCTPGTPISLTIVGGNWVNNKSPKTISWINSTTSATSNYTAGVGNPIGYPGQPTINVTTWFRAILTNGNCNPDTTPPIRIFVPSGADAANAGNDTAVCGVQSFLLQGNVPVVGTGYWKMAVGVVNAPLAGAYTFVSNTDTTSQNPLLVNITFNTTYKFVWTIKNLTCDATGDTITVVNTVPITINNISVTQDTVCSGTKVNLSGSTITGGNPLNIKYTWQESTNAGGIWTNVGNLANAYSFTATQDIWVRRVVKSDSCESFSNTIKFIVHQPITNNVITTPAAICTGTLSPTISGVAPSGGDGVNYTYSWDTANNQNYNNGIWGNVAANTVSYNPSVILTDTLNVRRIVVSGKCTSYSDTIMVTVNPDAKASFTTPIVAPGCAPFKLLIQGPGISLITNYTWYVDTLTGRATLGTGSAFPGYTIVNGLDSAKITLLATSTLGCKSDSVSKWFYTSATPVAKFTVSSHLGCANNTGLNTTNFNYINTTANQDKFSYTFDYGDGTSTSFVGTGNPLSHTYPPSTTGLDQVYTVTLTALSPSCGSSQWTDTIRIRTKPHVNFSVTPSSQCSGGIVKFYDKSVTSPNATNLWIFGDGGTATDKDSTQHIYNVNAVTGYEPKILVTNECGVDSFKLPISIIANSVTLNISVNPNDQYKCLPDTVTFYTNSVGATSYIWDFADGTGVVATNGIDSVRHPFATAGAHTVTLTGSTFCGSVTATTTVYAYATPNVTFSVSPTTACIGDTVSFTNQFNDSTSYNWSFGSGVPNPKATFSTVGVVPVQLSAIRQHKSPLGGPVYCPAVSGIQNITIRDTMLATFTVKQTNTNCLPFDARFINTTSIPTQPVIVTNWTFGDGSASVASNDSVNHSYGVLGTYNPSVIIKNAGGCVYAGSNTVSVFGPTGTWTHNTGYICGAKPVTFTVNGNSYTDSLIVDFGDGTVSRMLYATNPTFTHSYLTGGDKNPTIILKSLNGCEFPINANGLIRVDSVKASYTSAVTQPQPCGSSTRTFTNTSTMDQSPALATYNWIIKTSTFTTKDASLTSFANDTFNVFMLVTSVSGCSDTVTVTQFTTKVNNFPQGLIINRADSVCAGQTVKYTVDFAPSEDPITNYIWNFGNGTTVTGINTKSTETFYGTAGLYSDTVTVVTDKGCTATKVQLPLLRVLSTPTSVSINPGSDQTICQGTTSTTLQGTGAANYYWTPNIALAPNDSSQTVTASPLTYTRYTVHGYNVFGTYSCEDTASVNVFVVPQFNARIVPIRNNDSICLGDSITLSVEGAPAGSSFFWGPSTLIGTFKDSIMTGNPVNIRPIISSPYTVTVVPPSSCQNPQPLVPINIGVGIPINVNLGLDTVTLAAGSTYQFSPNYGPDEVSVTWTPASEFQNIHDPYPSIIVKASTCYAVQASSIFGCKDTAQLCIRSFCQGSQVFIPNAFTPGNDGYNDRFYITADPGIKTVLSLRVFNRWGQVVFERSNYKPDPSGTPSPNTLTSWDGKFKGTIAPTDIYVYTCEVECFSGTRFTYTGNVALIK